MSEFSPCAICRLHSGGPGSELWIQRSALWLLRHHPLPAPLPGWLLLDSLRHAGGPVDFDEAECADMGPTLRRCSALVRTLTGCDRVYAIAFGEGARHFHLHLIPRHGADPASESWRVADLYRQVASGQRPPASPDAVRALVEEARRHPALW
jgi:diadenosine tetraphosphate (Ap4A) HIT family hydrolase